MSDQIHAPAVLPPAIEHPVPTRQVVGWTPDPVWMTWTGENSWPHRGLPPHGQLLYQLRYPSSRNKVKKYCEVSDAKYFPTYFTSATISRYGFKGLSDAAHKAEITMITCDIFYQGIRICYQRKLHWGKWSSYWLFFPHHMAYPLRSMGESNPHTDSISNEIYCSVFGRLRRHSYW
jgi:hypothetical protein